MALEKKGNKTENKNQKSQYPGKNAGPVYPGKPVGLWSAMYSAECTYGKRNDRNCREGCLFIG